MVAYSFAPQFIAPIEARSKLQTVRGHRRRHARVGEPIQLYTAMRTKQCRKLIDVDPTCLSVLPISIGIVTTHPELITSIAVGCSKLDSAGIERFAQLDGFMADRDATARRRMGEFWLKNHEPDSLGWIGFKGVVIRWGWPQ